MSDDSQSKSADDQSRGGVPNDAPALSAEWPRSPRNLSQSLLDGMDRKQHLDAPLSVPEPTVPLSASGSTDVPDLTFAIVDLPAAPEPTVRLDAVDSEKVPVPKVVPTVRLDRASVADQNEDAPRVPAPTTRLDQAPPGDDATARLAPDTLADGLEFERTFNIGEPELAIEPPDQAESLSPPPTDPADEVRVEVAAPRRRSRRASHVVVLALLMAAALFGAVHVGMWLSTTYRDDDRGNTGLGVLRADEVTVLTSASDVDWIDKEVERFNKENGKGFHATRLPLLESGVGMEAILKGERQPVIYAPTSPFWIDHLQAAWESAHPRDTLANRDDPATFRTLGRSPLVVLTTADKAPFLASVFGSDHPWDALSRAAIGQLNAPWGKVKFGLADPGGSTVSMLTIGLLARDYASVHGQVVTADLVKSPGFQQYIASLAKANVRDSAIVSAAALERAYATDPTSRDFVMTTEARAMTLCETNPSLRVIYPKETATAEFSAVMLTAPWIHAKAHDGGAAFLAFISQPPAAQDAVAAHIRPLPGDQSDAFIATVKQRASQGFRVDVPTSPVPAYDPMSAAAAEWDSAAK